GADRGSALLVTVPFPQWPGPHLPDARCCTRHSGSRSRACGCSPLKSKKTVSSDSRRPACESPPTVPRFSPLSRTSPPPRQCRSDRKSTRLNSSQVKISYAVFCVKKKKIQMLNDFL